MQGSLTDEHRRLLASCYESCLTLAAEHGLKGVAFCCISTGASASRKTRRPISPSAPCGTGSMRIQTLHERVVFDVFEDADLLRYERLLYT